MIAGKASSGQQPPRFPMKTHLPSAGPLAIHPGAIGLDGVIAAETALSHVDGAAGRLIVRGHDLDELEGWSFEAVLALLWRDLLPGPPGEGELRASLGRARGRAFALLGTLLPATDGLSSVEALRLLLAAL